MYVCMYVWYACMHVHMYVCVCVCMYVCRYRVRLLRNQKLAIVYHHDTVMLRMLFHWRQHRQRRYVCMYVCMCVLYFCVYVHMYVYMYICIYVCMCMHICMYVCIYVYVTYTHNTVRLLQRECYKSSYVYYCTRLRLR